MRVETGRDEDHFRPEFVESRHPQVAHDAPELFAVGTSGERYVEHVGRRTLGAAIGIEGVLKGAHHEHAWIGPEAVFSPIAVMHIEVDHGHARQLVGFQRMRRSDRDIVEKTETHCACTFGVMTRRTNRAEGTADFALHHQIDFITRSTASTPAPAARKAACQVCRFIAVSGSR